MLGSEKPSASSDKESWEKKLVSFEERFGVNFHSRVLLSAALTHKSYSTKHSGMEHNERLSFLGDGVLYLITSDHVFRSKNLPEKGAMHNEREEWKDGSKLAEIAKRLGIEHYLRSDVDGTASSGMLAEALEAVIGAIYLDQGFAKAKKFVQRHIIIEDS